MFSKYHWLMFGCILWLNTGQYAWAVENVVEPIKTFLDTGSTVSHTESVSSIAFSPNGQWLLTGSTNGTIKLWDIATGAEVRSYTEQGSRITLVDFSPDGQQIVVETATKKLVVMNVNTSDTTLTLDQVSTNTLVGYNPHERITFAPDSLSLFIANKETTEQWSLESGVLMRTFANAAFPIDVSADGQLLVTVNQNYYTPIDHDQATQVQVIDIATAQIIETYNILQPTDNPPITGTIISSLQFSPDGQKILQLSSRSANNDATKLWDRNTGQAMNIDKKGDFARFSPDGSWALFGYTDAPMEVIDLATGQVAQVFGENTNIPKVISALSYDGTQAASFEQRRPTVWNVLTGNKTRVFEDTTATDSPFARYDLSALALSPNGKWLSFADKFDNVISLLDAQTGEILQTFEGHEQQVQKLVFTSDSQRLISMSNDNILKQWEIETGLELQNFTSSTTMLDVAVAPNGQQLLLLKEGFLELQDLSNALIWSQAITDTVNAINFSPDSNQIITAGSKLTIRETATGTVTQNFPIENEISFAQFSPDSQSIIVADTEGLAVWDIASSQSRRVSVLNMFETVSSLSVSANGQWAVIGISVTGSAFISASTYQQFAIRMVNINTGELVRTFEGVSTSGPPSRQEGFDFVSLSPLGNFVYTTSAGYYSHHFKGINKWYSGLGAVVTPENNMCTDGICRYELSVSDAGFYVAEVTLPISETEGQWGLSINNSSGSNPSGFSAGSVLRRNGEAPGFMGFYVTEPTTINLQVIDYLDRLDEVSVTLVKNSTEIVYGPVNVQNDSINQIDVLEAGYYVVTVSSLVGDERSYVGVGVYGDNIQSNVDIGGMIDENTGLGFIGFLVSQPMDVQLNLFYAGNYHRLGASRLKLEIFQQQVDEAYQSIWSADNP